MTHENLATYRWQADPVRTPILDVIVTPITASEVVNLIHEPATSVSTILNHNLHSAYLYRKHAWFRDLYADADVVAIDGWPVLKLAGVRKRGGLKTSHRIGSTDWIEVLKEKASDGPGLRVFLFGGAPESNAEAVRQLSRGGAGLDVRGHDGYVNPNEWQRVIDQIEEFQPQLVLLGMGMPLQEQFLSSHSGRLPHAHYATVGGAIDYVAGFQRLSPRIFGSLGIEWLWRLANDPRRLFARYCVEPLLLLGLIARDSLRKKGA